VTDPERSPAIARALAEEADGLPADFAARVASRAEADRRARQSRWSDLALPAAFLTMLSLCAVGWSQFGNPEPLGFEWLNPLLDAAVSRPWLSVGIAGVAAVHLLAFRRRRFALNTLG
jgi:hypothetical protein